MESAKASTILSEAKTYVLDKIAAWRANVALVRMGIEANKENEDTSTDYVCRCCGRKITRLIGEVRDYKCYECRQSLLGTKGYP